MQQAAASPVLLHEQPALAAQLLKGALQASERGSPSSELMASWKVPALGGGGGAEAASGGAARRRTQALGCPGLLLGGSLASAGDGWGLEAAPGGPQECGGLRCVCLGVLGQRLPAGAVEHKPGKRRDHTDSAEASS